MSADNTKQIDKDKTMELDNDILLGLMETYLKESTAENLSKLVSCIVKCRVLAPANFNDKKQPVPVYIKNENGDVFLPIYTDKKQIPKNPGGILMINLTYLEVNNMIMNPKVGAQGIVINPFTSNLLFKKELIERIDQVEKERKEKTVQNVTMTPMQYVLFERNQFENYFLPNRFLTNGETFVKELSESKEAYVDQLFEESYQQVRMYPYLEEEFSVMNMNITEEFQLFRIDMPARDLPVGACVRIYLAWDQKNKTGRYFKVERTSVEGELLIVEMDEKFNKFQHGKTMGEGAELDQIVSVCSSKLA